MNQIAQKLTKELFDSASKIKLNDAAGIFGTTSKQSMLQDLQKSIAELGVSLSAEEAYENVMQKHEAVVAALDTAGVTGLIGESEISDYYKLVDDIWAAIERKD